MFVLTIDQEGSRTRGDQVDDLLARLRSRPDLDAGAPGVAAAFERTVGDEVQCVLSDAGLAVDVVLEILRWGGWTVGIGAGPVQEPLPASSRAGSGLAFVLARDAVTQAKSRLRPVPLVVRGTNAGCAQDAEALLVLLGTLVRRRTTAGWQAVDASRSAGESRQEDVARALGVTQQAVSQRLRSALWNEELAARPLAVRLLDAAAGGPEPCA